MYINEETVPDCSIGELEKVIRNKRADEADGFKREYTVSKRLTVLKNVNHKSSFYNLFVKNVLLLLCTISVQLSCRTVALRKFFC